MKLSSKMLQILPYFWNTKTQIVFFRFSFRATFFFFIVEALVSVDIDQGIHYYNSKVARNEKNLFNPSFQKYGKFWSISLDNFTKHKPLISEEWSLNEWSYICTDWHAPKSKKIFVIFLFSFIYISILKGFFWTSI